MAKHGKTGSDPAARGNSRDPRCQRLKAALRKAYAAPETTYLPLTAADVIRRNARWPREFLELAGRFPDFPLRDGKIR